MRCHIIYDILRANERADPVVHRVLRHRAGRTPAAAYIASLPESEQARVTHDIDLLEEFGVALAMPTARHIEGDLWELRPGPHRVFYCIVTGRRCILLCGYRKQGNKAPAREIARALRYMADWWEREG